ncbi:hypothetical protein [Nitrosomonas sp. wSCUT-2]
MLREVNVAKEECRVKPGMIQRNSFPGEIAELFRIRHSGEGRNPEKSTV